MIDTHCHFNFFLPEQQKRLWEEMQTKGVQNLIIPSVERKGWKEVLDIATQFSAYPAYGLHPIYQHRREDLSALDEWLAQYPAIAIGECGLDFYMKIDRIEQQYLLEGQIELAISHDLPLILHARQSLEQVLQTLKCYPKARFVIHTFTGSDRQLEKIFELGGYIGIGGTSTYPRAMRLRKQLISMPSDRYILETDAPDQPLYGHQGKENTPAQTLLVAKNLSKLRNCSVIQIVQESSTNVERLFKLSHYIKS